MTILERLEIDPSVSVTSADALLASLPPRPITTPITTMLGIRYPILQAGMAGVAIPELVSF